MKFLRCSIIIFLVSFKRQRDNGTKFWKPSRISFWILFLFFWFWRNLILFAY